MANPYVVKERDLDERKRALFIDYKKKRRVNTRLVRSSWRRVIVSAIAYALALSFARFCWIQMFGRPSFFSVPGAPPAASAAREPATH